MAGVKQFEIELPENATLPIHFFKPRSFLTANVGPKGGTGSIKDGKVSEKNAEEPQKCFTQVFDGNIFEKKSEITHIQPKSKRRVQSAKPRLLSDKPSEKQFEASDSKTQKRKTRPASAVVARSNSCTSDKYKVDIDKVADEHSTPHPVSEETSWNQTKTHLEPSVYGYQSQCYISNQIMQDNFSDADKVKQHHVNKDLLCNDNISLSDLLDYDDIEEDNFFHNRQESMPKTLKPLLPWMTPTIPQQWIGVDPTQCLVFLPSLLTEVDSLPCVPPPTKAGDPLPGDRLPVPPPAKPKKMLKYDHPWTKIPIEEPQCCHHGKSRSNDSNIPQTPRVRIIGQNGTLLHQSQIENRTEDIVRKEIKELENLMKGLGDQNGCSIIVQYQAEINKLQDMITETIDRVEEIERREHLKMMMSQPTDYFGLQSFYKQHDVVIEQIKKQHARCVAELHVLTGELELESARRHFSARLKLVDS